MFLVVCGSIVGSLAFFCRAFDLCFVIGSGREAEILSRTSHSMIGIKLYSYYEIIIMFMESCDQL